MTGSWLFSRSLAYLILLDSWSTSGQSGRQQQLTFLNSIHLVAPRHINVCSVSYSKLAWRMTSDKPVWNAMKSTLISFDTFVFNILIQAVIEGNKVWEAKVGRRKINGWRRRECTFYVDTTTASKYIAIPVLCINPYYMYDVHFLSFSTWLLVATLICFVMKLLFHSGHKLLLQPSAAWFKSTEPAMECFAW